MTLGFQIILGCVLIGLGVTTLILVPTRPQDDKLWCTSYLCDSEDRVIASMVGEGDWPDKEPGQYCVQNWSDDSIRFPHKTEFRNHIAQIKSRQGDKNEDGLSDG